MSRRAEPELLPEPALNRLLAAKSVVAFTGAGMSAESGIPTFREAQTGLWSRFSPEELATPGAFHENPRRVWRWYAWRRELVREARPHQGYVGLVGLERLLDGFRIVTQNVDGLHQAAGSENVIELHGNIMRSICSRTRRPIDDEWLKDQDGEPPPSPHHPDGMARPDVVWFGEPLPTDAMEEAWSASQRADVFLCIGTSALVQPAASLPVLAAESGAMLIEINPDPTPLSSTADHRIAMGAGPALAWLYGACRAHSGSERNR